MDGVSLLDRAQAAGLSVRLEGDHLVIRGPRSAQALVEELRAHKGEVLLALQDGAPCVRCGTSLPPGWELCAPCLRANVACLDCGATSDPIAKKPVAGYARCIPCVVKGALKALGLEKKP